MLRWQQSNQVWLLNLRLTVQMTCTWTWKTRASSARRNLQRRQNKHQNEHSMFNDPDASLNVSSDLFEVERSKCGRHEPAVLVSLTFWKSAQLLQGDSRDPLCEGLRNDTIGHMNVTTVGGNNPGLNARAVTFARSNVVKLIGRLHLHVFNQERLILSNIDLHMKMISSPNDFLCKSSAPGLGAQQ